MHAIKCPACGHLISPHSQLADGKITCPGCKKSYAVRKKDPAAAAPASPPPPGAPAEGAAPPAAPRHSRIPPRTALHGKISPRPAPLQRPPVPDLDADFPPEEKPPGKPGIPRDKKILMIALPCILILCVGVLLLFVSQQFQAAGDAKRTAAGQVLQVLALKWIIEAEGVKECEAAWKDLRSEKNAMHLQRLLAYEPQIRDLGLRVWMYEHRSQDQLDRITKLLSLTNYDSNQLLDLKAHETKPSLHTEDVALDWLTSRGYRIFENLRKKGAVSASAGDAGAKVDSSPPGGVRMSVFGSSLEADYDAGQSAIDIDSGVLRVVFQTNYAGLYDPVSGPGALQASAKLQGNQYFLDFRDEIQEYFKSPGTWATRSFESGGAGAPPADVR